MTEPVSPIGTTETFNSLTGFDEIAIEQAFGSNVMTLRENPTFFVRCLVFIHQRRQAGVADAAAKKTAMEMTLTEAQAYFPDDDPDELDPDDPETDQGKDSTPSG